MGHLSPTSPVRGLESLRRPTMLRRMRRHSSMARALRQRLRAVGGDEAFTLIELLVSMSILVVVVGSITGALIEATKSEADLNNRFQSQVQARLALTKLTREIHCAKVIQDQNGSALTTTAVAGITVTLPAGCPTGDGAATTVRWCTLQDGTRWDLYRYDINLNPGSACGSATGGVLWAAGLTSGTPFSQPTTIQSSALTLVHVSLPVNVQGSGGGPGSYTLSDDIAALNACRSGTTC